MDEARGLGLHGAPTVVRVSDVGPFGIASPTCLDTAGREAVIERLEALAARDPREVFEALQFACVPEDPASYTAELLFLQRLSFSGKAVGDRDGRWVSPGFNASSAYGLPATERFGRVSPMVPSLLRVLRGYRNLQAARIEGGREPATEPSRSVDRPTLVYLDPPYVASTPYPGGSLSRADVIRLARAWRAAGAAVVVSEGEPIEALVADGWRAARIDAGRVDASRFRGKQPEWVTFTAA